MTILLAYAVLVLLALYVAAVLWAWITPTRAVPFQPPRTKRARYLGAALLLAALALPLLLMLTGEQLQ